MPWKTTKLKYLGVSVRRRTLYVVSLLFAILAVPLISWALINSGTQSEPKLRYGFAGAALICVLLSMIGWWTIIRQHIVLYWEEARFIWPATIPIVLGVMWMTYRVSKTTFSRGRLDYLAPLTFGTLLLGFFVVRCVLLGRHPKKTDIVRGESGPARPRANRSLPVANVMIDELEKMNRRKKRSTAGTSGAIPSDPANEKIAVDDLDD
ncbi:MAG TPA: hypothetical protein VK737_01800 [Opitutales bacterium]|jgi:hypothetical protein|nr:hypothetical protein [Opitutales bacterium]